MHPGAAVGGMLAQEPAGALGIARRDGGDDRLVLPHGYREATPVLQPAQPKEQQLLGEQAIDLAEPGIAGELDQPVVKPQVHGVIALDVAAAGCVLHLGDHPLELRDVLAPRARGHASADQLVHHLAHIVDLIGFRHRYIADEHSPVLLRAHQTALLERAQGLAHRSPARAEPHRQLALVEALPDGQLAAKDELLDLLLHECGQRARPQQLQRREWRYGARRARHRAGPFSSGNCQLLTVYRPASYICNLIRVNGCPDGNPMSNDPYLLTPGPLTTSLRTRQAMLRDWGSWDVDFNT